MTDLDLPPIGLGSWQLTPHETCASAVASGLEMGYRHVDTAQVYGTEPGVREGMERSGVPRDEVILASKIHEDEPGPGYDAIPAAAEERLDVLGVDVLDLLYVHWPIGSYAAERTLPEFDDLVDRGLVRRVGLSNFTTELLDEAIEVLDAPLAAHQVEMHPFLQQDELVAHAQANDYWLVAYSPLARGEVFDDPVIADVADKYDVSPAQVSLAWVHSHESVVAIPKASSEGHLRDNLGAAALELDDADVERIDAIERTERFVDRPEAPWNG